MRHPTAALAVAVICVLSAGCASSQGSVESTTTTRSMIPRPVVERELAGLLLSPEQLNVAMGATAMTVTNTQTSMSDNSATMAPQECLAIDGAAEAPVYANSGYWAERDQSLNDGDNFTHYVKQAVVLFPTVEKAGALFDAAATAVAGLPPVHPHAERVAVVRRADLQHERHTEYHRDSTECQCPRLGLWTGAGAQKQRHYRHQHVQR